MVRAVALLSLALLLLAGCGGKVDDAATAATTTSATTDIGTTPSPAPRNATITPAGTVAVEGDAVTVSVAGHRTSEFMVAHDPSLPTHLLASGMDWDSADATVQCAAFVSKDAGKTWTAVQGLPGHASQREDTDPWVAFDGNGTAYLTCTEGGVGLLLGQSKDGGATWSTAAVVPTGGLPIKDAVGAFGDGEVYVCFQQNGKLQVLRSVDHATTWQNVGAPPVAAGCNGVQRHGGRTYVLWQSGGQLEADNLNPAPPGVGVLWSSDGVTFRSVTVQETLGAAPPNMQSAPQAAAPSLALSNVTGHLVLAAQQYQNAEVAGGVGTATAASALYWRSTDGGVTFVPIDGPSLASETCQACSEVHPTAAFDAAGRLLLQVTLSTGDSSHKEVVFLVSNDEGDSWLPMVAVASADPVPAGAGNVVPDPNGIPNQVEDIVADPASAPGAASARVDEATWPLFHRDGGEYFGITGVPGGALAMWVHPDANGRNTIFARSISIQDTGP